MTDWANFVKEIQLMTQDNQNIGRQYDGENLRKHNRIDYRDLWRVLFTSRCNAFVSREARELFKTVIWSSLELTWSTFTLISSSFLSNSSVREITWNRKMQRRFGHILSCVVFWAAALFVRSYVRSSPPQGHPAKPEALPARPKV